MRNFIGTRIILVGQLLPLKLLKKVAYVGFQF